MATLQLPTLDKSQLEQIQKFIESVSKGHQYTVTGTDHRGRYRKTLFKVAAMPTAFIGNDFNSMNNDVWILTWDTISKITCMVWNSEKKIEESVLVYKKS